MSPGRLELTLAIDSEGVGAKTTNLGCAREKKEVRDGSAVANATATTARLVNNATATCRISGTKIVPKGPIRGTRVLGRRHAEWRKIGVIDIK